MKYIAFEKDQSWKMWMNQKSVKVSPGKADSSADSISIS